ncbi:MAG: hypothetical protein V2J42_00045 [Wenzhouxiangella sp.]|nr:hypothetical protein [Wenzhouxiangella sp.]
MLVRLRGVIGFFVLMICLPAGAGNQVAYLPGPSENRLHVLHSLSDGTVLAGGQASDLEWVPTGVPVRQLQNANIDSSSPGAVAFVAHLSQDLSAVLSVTHFPPGSVRSVDRIRSTERPGEHTGSLFISGRRDQNGWQRTGYFIARLNGNFVDAMPTGLTWSYEVKAEPRRAGGRNGESAYKTIQPWDVNASGEVYFGSGSEYDWDWAMIEKLDASGQRTTVEHWPVHWIVNGGECYSPASECAGEVGRSGIVLKAGRRGSLRSRTQAEFDRRKSDGNGRIDRPGTFPDDYFFSGPCGQSSCPAGPGHTGYRTSDKPTQRLGGIAVDRASGAVAIGYSTQSRLPGGNPDFEPAIVVFDADGQLRWWNRLYEETNANSSPDQYVDALEIDHVHARVVVLARAHGNNVINFWRGNEVDASPGARGFQNRFTGTNGNIHLSWLGAFDLASGALAAATYIAEYPNSTGGLGGPHPDPKLAHWPDPNQGWPNLNTTRCRNHIALGSDGSIGVVCTGRRPITTDNAHQPMLTFDQGHSKWSDFARVYTPDLSGMRYSTLLTNGWDGTSAGDPNAVALTALLIDQTEIRVAGFQSMTENVSPVPTVNAPPWMSSGPNLPGTGILAILSTEPVEPPEYLFRDRFRAR